MSTTIGRISRWFGVALAVVAVAGSYGHAWADQQEAAAATAKLKALSESPGIRDVNQVRQLIASGADVNVRNKFGNTPLWMASLGGDAKDTEVVKLLLASKANVDVRDKFGATPLHVASQFGNTEVVKLLLEAGANVNAADKDGDTPLMAASRGGHTEAVNPLLVAGANVNAADKDGDTPLMAASRGATLRPSIRSWRPAPK